MRAKLVLVPLAAAISLLSLPGPVTAQHPAPTQSTGHVSPEPETNIVPTYVEPEAAESETAPKKSRPPFKFELGVGVTFDQQFLRTRESEANPQRNFKFTGMGFRLRSYLGTRFGFLFDGAFLLPISGTQPGNGTFRLREVYSKVLGADLLPMFAYRGEFREKFAFRAGIGPHMTFFNFAGNNIRPFQNTSLGVGISGDVLYDITKLFHVGGQATVAVDFVDLIHDTGKLRTLTAWNIGVLVGVRIR